MLDLLSVPEVNKWLRRSPAFPAMRLTRVFFECSLKSKSISSFSCQSSMCSWLHSINGHVSRALAPVSLMAGELGGSAY